MEENHILNGMYESTKKELEEVVVKLEEELNERKTREFSLNADVENLKAEVAEKSAHKLHISKLEQQFSLSEQRFMQEVTILYFSWFLFLFSQRKNK